MKRWLPIFLVFAVAACDRQQEIPAGAYDDGWEASPDEEFQPSEGTRRAEAEMRRKGAELTVYEAVQGFRAVNGRFPNSLDELVSDGNLGGQLPDLPEGYEFDYEPESGQVTVVESGDEESGS